MLFRSVVRDILCQSYLGDKLGTVKAGVETIKNYTYSVPANYDSSQMSVIVCSGSQGKT